jgi:RNA-directed DNA polymerase
MTTKLEEIAAKAKRETKLQFTSLCHHITPELVWESLKHIPTRSAPGVDGVSAKEARDTFQDWINQVIQAMHNKGYKPLPVRRVWIPKPGKTEKRPLGVPCIPDRALQRSTALVLSAIYEQDFMKCSFGGRQKLSAHNALSTLEKVIAGKKVSWVLEADLKSFFCSLNHEWMIKFVKHRIGDPRIIKLIQRWLKAGVLENDKLQENEIGTPQGGSISVLLSNIYLHYVLDLWFEKAIKPRIKGECYLIRYIDDFVVCFQYRTEAERFQKVLPKRLAKFALELEPKKTRLVEFGRFAQVNAKKWNREIETIYFLGLTHYCSRNSKGNFMLGRKTEKTRLKRSMKELRELMCKIKHKKLREQAQAINQVLRGHYAYYGLGGNSKSINKIYYFVVRLWHKTLSRRSWKGYITWEQINRIKEKVPILKPKLKYTYVKLQKLAVL